MSQLSYPLALVKPFNDRGHWEGIQEIISCVICFNPYFPSRPPGLILSFVLYTYDASRQSRINVTFQRQVPKFMACHGAAKPVWDPSDRPTTITTARATCRQVCLPTSTQISWVALTDPMNAPSTPKVCVQTEFGLHILYKSINTFQAL